MLSYCLLEVAAKEEKENSKVDETALVGLASWPPTRALVIKALLVKEASMIRMTFVRQFMRFKLVKQFFCV
jgi:hypothetical protein